MVVGLCRGVSTGVGISVEIGIRMKKFFALTLLFTSSLALADDPATRLDLVCVGAGSANRPSNTYAYAQNNNGGSAWANIVGNRSVPFDDQVNLWVAGSEGRIRMPRTMLPPLHGGEDGWFKINSLKVGENEITGSVGVNFMNKPKLRIDRLTGAISIAGKAGDYSGRCVRYDPSEASRAF